MRPDPACRTFTSLAVEVSQFSVASFARLMSCKDVIRGLGNRMKDPDLARLFENTFPNTLGEYSVIVNKGFS